MTSYPPEPWALAGEAYVSVWAVPPHALPRVPSVVTPVTIGRSALVVTAWIDYTPPGRMTYHELLSTVAVRHGGRPAGTITEIWVDSVASLTGGRALWGIPKELANLDFRAGRAGTGRAFTATATTGDDWIATAAFTPRGPSGPPVPTGFSVIQPVEGSPFVSPVRATVRPRPASADWNVNPDGPLGHLARRRPLASAHLGHVRLLFGSPRR